MKRIYNMLKGIYLAFIKNDKNYRYLIAEKISNNIFPFFTHTENDKYFLEDVDFVNDYKKFDNQNFRSMDRKYMLIQMLKLTKHLSGSVAECGVFKWATSYFILKNIDSNKKLHLFDSFEWLSNPSGIDWNHWCEWSLYASEDEVKNNLKDFNNIVFHKWRIPNKFHEVLNEEFSFVHIDVDLYEPTKDSIEFFYKKLQKWWMIICDDSWFKTCPWARKAIIEFSKINNIEFLDLPTWQWIMIKM